MFDWKADKETEEGKSHRPPFWCKRKEFVFILLKITWTSVMTLNLGPAYNRVFVMLTVESNFSQYCHFLKQKAWLREVHQQLPFLNHPADPPGMWDPSKNVMWITMHIIDSVKIGLSSWYGGIHFRFNIIWFENFNLISAYGLLQYTLHSLKIETSMLALL